MDLSIEPNVLYAIIVAFVIAVVLHTVINLYKINKQKQFDADFAKFLTNLKKNEHLSNNNREV